MSSDAEEQFPVKVYVYDISNGLASIYGPLLLGVELEAIFHTSVVVYGREYFLSQGIQVSQPGSTKFGTPKEVLEVGNTEVIPDIFEDFIEDLKHHEERKYHASKYDLFDNNCNHFTDAVLDFLVGCHLEDRILRLPQHVLNSPQGPILRQLLQGFTPEGGF